MRLLPPIYKAVQQTLDEYFPEDFDLAFNGKSLPWEAACLIPFANEKVFLEQEKKVFSDKGYNLSAKE